MSVFAFECGHNLAADVLRKHYGARELTPEWFRDRLFTTSREAFNFLNTVNVRFFNTVYNAADFCNFNPAAQGCSATQRFLEGSPNPNYGTPRAVYNPRQIQFALRLTY